MSAGLGSDAVASLSAQLEALGWEIEWSDNGPGGGYIEVFCPDRQTGRAMQFSGWWLSWRAVDGHLAYGVGDDTADFRWRQPLDIADPADVQEIARAADRAMHLLWHEEERDLRASLYKESAQLRALRQDVEAAAGRLVVTPGTLRAVLKSRRGSW